MNQGSPILPALMKNLRSRIESTTPLVRMGEVVQVTGLVIESVGPNVSLGDICEIRSPRLKGLQADIDKLKREMVRKDKALAEAAALLILQKKFSALWADEEK